MKSLINGHLWQLDIDLFGATVYCVLAERSEDWVQYLDPIKGDSADEWFNNLKERVSKASDAANAATVSNA